MEWLLIILALATVVFLVLSIVGWSLKNGISPMPTSRKVKRVLKTLLPKPLSGNIYELGSGWGSLVCLLSKEYPDCHIIGFETSPIPYWFSRFWVKVRGCWNTRLVKKDFFNEKLEDADLVVCYLYPGAMGKLKRKFEAELKPGTFVITHTFAMPSWTPIKIMDSKDLYHSKVYLYVMTKE